MNIIANMYLQNVFYIVYYKNINIFNMLIYHIDKNFSLLTLILVQDA
jgi:hypothetical protein